jgi:hypothetical protein
VSAWPRSLAVPQPLTRSPAWLSSTLRMAYRLQRGRPASHHPVRQWDVGVEALRPPTLVPDPLLDLAPTRWVAHQRPNDRAAVRRYEHPPASA